jgi:hypothetical protein
MPSKTRRFKSRRLWPSRETIAEARSTPAAPPAAITPPWTPAAIALLESRTLPDPALAERLGISTYAVRSERVRRGIEPCAGGRKPRGAEAASVSRTIKLTPADAALTDDAAGDQPWGTWARDRLVEIAAKS